MNCPTSKRTGGWHCEQTGCRASRLIDALINGDFRHFAEANWIELNSDQFECRVPDKVLESGEAYFAEVEAAKAKYREIRAKTPKGQLIKTRKGEILKETDPWPA